MFAIQKLGLLLLLSSICFSLGDLSVDSDNLDTTLCEFHMQRKSSKASVTLEEYNALSKQLCETRVGLVERERNALHLQVEWQKAGYMEQIAVLKKQNEQNYANYHREKIVIQDNCELREKLASQNVTLLKEYSQKLFECITSLQIKEKECGEDAKSLPGMVVKGTLTKLSTGYYLISKEQTNWYLASKRCKARGLELVSIENKEENDALRGIIDAKYHYWTSGTDLGAEGHFYWASTGHYIGAYSDFHQGQPDNFGSKEHCLEGKMSLNGTQLKWNDIPCDSVTNYICEYNRF